ncbi:MAG: hypothetical protein ABR986_08785 [Methanomassiliicoccales archaeon]
MVKVETYSVPNNETKTLNKLLGMVKDGKLKGFTNTNLTEIDKSDILAIVDFLRKNGMDDGSILRYLRFIKEESIRYKGLEMGSQVKDHHSNLGKREAGREPIALSEIGVQLGDSNMNSTGRYHSRLSRWKTPRSPIHIIVIGEIAQ